MRTVRCLALAAGIFAVPLGLCGSSSAAAPSSDPSFGQRDQQVTESRVVAALQLLAADRRLEPHLVMDVHNILLAPLESALPQLARQLCSESQSRARERVNSLSAVEEPHAGQTLLALSTVAIRAPTKIVPVCNVPIATLIAREMKKRSYEAALTFLSGSLSAVLRSELAKTPPEGSRQFAEWIVSPSRRDLRQRLTAIDLSWYGQLATLLLALAPPDAAGSRDGYVMLRRVLDAQLNYAAGNRTYPSLNYLTEAGVHTLAMLLVALEELEKHPGPHSEPQLTTYKAIAREFFADLVSRATLDGHRTSTEAVQSVLRAHLLHLMLCGTRPLLLQSVNSDPSSSPASLNTLGDQVLRDVEHRAGATYPGWHLHAKDALLRLLRYIKGSRADAGFGDCICV